MVPVCLSNSLLSYDMIALSSHVVGFFIGLLFKKNINDFFHNID